MISNTETMVYNLKKHRYVLTNDAMIETFNLNLNDVLDSNGADSTDLLVETFLNRVSKILYNYIYSWAVDKSKTEYVISTPDYRDAIEEAMEELAYSFILNNTDPSIYFTGNSLKTIEIPPSVQTILLNNGLLFRGEYYNLPENFKQLRGKEY